MEFIKCQCGNKIPVGKNFCSNCGNQADYTELIKKEDNKILMYRIVLITIVAFISFVFLLCVASGFRYKIDKNTPEYQHFAESFETVISFYPEVDSYYIGERYIVINLNENKYSRQEKIANVIQTMAHNSEILPHDEKLTVKFNYNNKYLRSFY